MPSLEENFKVWNDSYHWSEDGDEWNDQAAFCNKPYHEWKQSILEAFLLPNIKSTHTVLEIACGHGRWSGHMARASKDAILVDMSPNCIEFCKKKFSDLTNVSYYVNDGKTLDFLDKDSVDFIWSFDAFVHMEKDAISSYFKEFARILKPEAKAIVHHAGRNNATLKYHNFFRPLGLPGTLLYQLISTGRIHKADGWRSNISKEMVKELGEKNGLIVDSQVDSWGQGYNTRLFKDWITTLRKP